MNKKLLIAIIAVIILSVLVLVFTVGPLGTMQQNDHYNLEYTLNGQYIEVINNQPFAVTVFIVYTNSTSGKAVTIQGPNLVPHEGISEYGGNTPEITIDNVYGIKSNPAAPTPSPIGLLGTSEQVSITNIQFSGSSTINVLVQNSGSSTVNISQAFVNGAVVTMSPNSPSIVTATSMTISLSLPTNTILSTGSSYSIKLVSAMNTQISATATYSP